LHSGQDDLSVRPGGLSGSKKKRLDTASSTTAARARASRRGSVRNPGKDL